MKREKSTWGGESRDNKTSDRLEKRRFRGKEVVDHRVLRQRKTRRKSGGKAGGLPREKDVDQRGGKGAHKGWREKVFLQKNVQKKVGRAKSERPRNKGKRGSPK